MDCMQNVMSPSNAVELELPAVRSILSTIKYSKPRLIRIFAKTG